MLSYKDTPVVLNGHRVMTLTMVGIIVERFLAMALHARRGFGALAWHDVSSVTLRNVYVNGWKRAKAEVQVLRRDAEVALRIAIAICERLEKFGFRLLDAIIPQLDASGKSCGEHDLIGERKPLRGKSSIEVKCRTIKKDHYRKTVRRQIQNLAWKLWPAAVRKPNHGWAERVVVMVEFAHAEDDVWDAIRCESLLVGADNDPESWKPLFGWGNEPPLAPRQPQSTLSTHSVQERIPVVSTTRLRTGPVENGPIRVPQVEATRKRKFEASYAKVRKCQLHDQEMGSVSDLLVDMKTPAAIRAKPTLGEKMPRWANSFQWPPHSWASTPQLRSKTGGGKWGKAATKAALNDIHGFLDR
jgi:hypothetical protein